MCTAVGSERQLSLESTWEEIMKMGIQVTRTCLNFGSLVWEPTCIPIPQEVGEFPLLDC